MRSFFFIFAILAIANGLNFVPDRPGLIPDLTKLESSEPFVWRQVDLSDQRKVWDLEHLVSLSLDDMQKANLDGAPYVNLVKIEQAIEEVVTGNNYAVVFSAEKGYPFLREPDNGRCFFTMFKSKDVDENAAPEVTKYVCVLIPGKE